MNRLDPSKRVSVVKALCEGVSVNATMRMTGVAKTSILRLLVDLGRVCMNHEDATLRNLRCLEVEADEIWAFNYCKAKTLPRATAPVDGAGDTWTWYAVDRKSKAILSWMMGDRDAGHAHAFMNDLASRLAFRVDLTTDALGVYANAVYDAFSRTGVDYAQVHKVYKTVATAPGREEAVCTGCTKKSVFGTPRLERAGTSRIERANLTLRMSQRRWTRKTNAHSKSFVNMQAAFALHSCFYNWCRVHASLEGKQTPAMVLGVADRVWSVEDLIGLLDADERAAIGTEANKRGPYRRKES